MPTLVRLTGTILFAGILAGCVPPPGQQRPLPRPTAQPQPQAQRPQPARPQQPRSTGIVVARGVGGAQADQETLEIHLDRVAMAANHIDQATVTEALAHFFNTFPYFSLIDLQETKIRSADGHEVPLRQIGTVDVWFGPAKTEIVVGSGK